MLVKFETKSARVKGLSFHSKRPWILASLHTGSIVLWDYELGNCLEKYEGHEGPVRGLSFHNDQPIFVSGGDDYQIKVWNYQLRRCVFSLLGHVDYIRSTVFHPKYPWILSASDDQTIRLWNWQSRAKIGLISGHTHYVMRAEFHPSLDLVVSASLDQTIRVWDISAIVKRSLSAKSAPTSDSTTKGRLQLELFGEADFETKFVLEGHDKGVNWATFHATLPLALSGSDDKNIKLWKMGDEKMWEVDTFRGHYNNVSSVLFHPRHPIVISASEDKSIRIWDMTRKTSLQIFRRSHDRFWIATAHPSKNLFCAGHDSGLMVFKLEKERPVWTLHEGTLYYVKEKYLRFNDLSTGQDISIMRLRGEGRAHYTCVSYNRVEHCVLLSQQEPCYELYKIPATQEMSMLPNSPVDWKKSSGRNALWIGRNRFAVLQNENHLIIKTAKNEMYRKIQLPFNCINIFPAGTGMLLLQQEPKHFNPLESSCGDKGERVIRLYDVQLKRIIAKIITSCKIKQVIWSCDMSRVALLGKSLIILCSSKLELYVNWVETGKVKSGAWREPVTGVGVFIYNTSAHLKYVLTNGDAGTIRTLDVPFYIVSMKNDQILCFDREITLRKYNMDSREIAFKMALIMENYSQVNEMIKNCKLVGQAIISYLHQKGYPEIALHFLQKQDERTRFNLALECCNLEVGLECARILDTAPVWNKLAEMALMLGNHSMVELCYQRTRNFGKLAFLYLVTGNTDKIKKLLKTSTAQGNDASGQYWMALVSGDVESQIKLLRNAGGPGKMLMAYKIAVGSHLTEIANEISSNVPSEQVDRCRLTVTSGSLHPPLPLIQQKDNWPLLTMPKSVFGGMQSLLKSNPQIVELHLESAPGSGEWADYENELSEEVFEECQVKGDDDEDAAAACGWDDHCDVLTNSVTSLEVSRADNYFLIPTKGTPVTEKWMETCRLPIVHVLSGHFESAARLLQEQIGVINISPFRQLFLNAHKKSHLVYTPSPNLPSLPMYPLMKDQLPQTCVTFNLNVLVNSRLRACYELVTKGQFMEAVEAYRILLLCVPLTLAQSKAEISKAQELITLCKEYILGLQMELYRKTVSKEQSQENQRRSLELAAYFTHCSLDDVHLMLALRTAMNLSYKLGYFKNASGFAQRLLELGPSRDLVLQARKLVRAAENKSNVSPEQLVYDNQNPFSICAKTYKPIYRGKADVKCPFCGAAYMPDYAGNLCNVCYVAEIGKSAMGLRISPIQFR